MEFKEVSSIVVGTEEFGTTELIQAGNCEPKAKKRRVGDSDLEIHDDSGNVTVSSIEDSFSIVGSEEAQIKVKIHGEFAETLVKVSGLGGNLMENVCVNGNLNENGSVNEHLKDNALPEVNLRENCCFDGDLKGNGSIASVEEPEKRENEFKGDVVYEGGTQIEEVNGDFKKIESLSPSEDTQVEGSGDFNEHEPGNSPLGRDVGIQSEDRGSVEESKENISGVFESTHTKDSGNTELYSRVGGTDDGGDFGGSDKVERRRKKRRVTFGNTNSTEIVLRRSSRRITSFSSPNHVSRVEESSKINIFSDEISVGSDPEGCKEQRPLPPKLELPPSSRNVVLDDIPILDVFSVYSCLRSFSTILFLSPFELEAFVAALKYKFPNSLMDSIHLSILQTLKLNLEFLSDEGSQSAANCLRSLNWGLLDSITWPVYMVEYLLMHGSGLKPGLNLLNSDYYKQPPTIKVEILRCLCDDLIEAEVIRSELNRRTIASELDMDVDRTSSVDMYKKRKDPMDESGGSCLTQEVVDKTIDWNSDECRLCKMDGNLICCDGCPAAYHSRCVGIVKDLLPEGDWYCPECVINKLNPCIKSAMSLRGAEVLGIDPYGRLYFSSCGYLLVSDSCETDSSYYYYHRDDLTIVLDVLKSSHILYNEIITAVSMNWGIPVGSGAKCHSESQIPNMHTDSDVEGQVLANGLPSIPIQLSRMDEAKGGTRKPSGMSAVNEGFETPENTNCNAMECSLKPNGSDVKRKKNIVSADLVHAFSVLNSGADLSHRQFEPDYYANYYSFAQIAASVSVELICKSSDILNDDSKRSAEELVTIQMKAISKKWTRFRWSNFQRLHIDAEKESCGWCFYCKNPTDGGDCMFNMANKKPSSEGSGEVGSCSKRNRNSHLTAIIYYILSIEERLSGLLSGPWHNLHYRKHWRKSVLRSSDVATLKHALLSLESNLHRLALSSEWLKLVDSVVTMGSASHILTRGQISSSRHGGSRKRAKVSHIESNSTSNGATRSGIIWWRGGRISRQVFHHKVLPRSLAFKGGRQAGCGKIPTLFYPDNSEFVRRSKYIAWRAAVEMSTSIPQLACQVRELDLNIRWDDLENTQLFSQLAQESIKLLRPFKKVSIRRKCIEGTHVKYLLDFGKRKTIPDAVIQHGVMLEVSASERRKYWLDESHVPLHLLKAFEEKKVARIATKTAPGVLREEAGKLMKKTTRKRGLSRLLSKSENYQCGQCNKDVPVREAVSCKDCKGFFHKKHFRTTKGTITSDCTYTCHKCQHKIHVKKPLKLKKKRGRPPLLAPKKKIFPAVPEKKISTAIPGRGRGRPRGSTKIAKHIALQSRKLAGINKQVESKKGASKKVIGSEKGKRTRVYHAFWLNGLRLTRKPNDARGMHFRETKLLLPSEDSNAVCTQPICCLCSSGYTSRLIYVRCENCQEWFHGDAFGLTLENSANLLGFRCHMCRKRNPPLCPHLVGLTVSRSIYMSQLSEDKKDEGVESVEQVPHDFDKSPTEMDEEHRFPPNEDSPHKNHKACEIPDSDHKEHKEDEIPFSNPNAVFMECEPESEKCIESVHKKQKGCAVPVSIFEDQKAHTVPDSNQIPLLEVCENESERGRVSSVGSLSGE